MEVACEAANEGASLLDRGLPTEARAALHAAVAAGDRRPATQLNLALAEDKAGDAEAAQRRIGVVERACPEWDEPPLRLAESLRRSDSWPAAEQAYRRVLDVNPARLEALVALGAGLVARGRLEEALPFLLRACDQPDPGFEPWHALGVARLALGDADLAEAALASASRAAPGRLDIALLRADAALAAGTAESELVRLEAAADASPLDPLPLRARAHLLEAMGRLEESADMLEAAAEIAPADAGCAAALGFSLTRLDRADEAEIALRRALALDPLCQQPRADLVAVLIRRLRFCEAEALVHGLVSERGEEALMLSNLATALVGQGRQEEAAAAARRATEVAPDAIQPWRILSSVLPYIATAEEHTMAVRACAQLYPRGEQRPFANTVEPERPLRVGLLSNALRTHPVGWLTLAGWEALDRTAFELFCLGPFSPGNLFARRFAARACAWHDTRGGSDAAVAALCREQRLDIVVDLGGHGEAGRLGVLAHRAAPVQVKWVGSQVGSSGLPEMDWFLTDRWETPPDCVDLYHERLLRLPDGYVCYDPPSHAPDVAPLPALTAGSVTFGCFNNLAKVTPDVIATWATILAAVPGSRLVLKAPQLDDPALLPDIRARLTAAGLDASRFMLRGASAHRDHLASYAEIDIALDPFPYAGGLSTCEALWMGVPTITLPGRSFASRHTLSHQENVGLSGWAAASPAEYVALAARWASDLEGLAALRAGLRPQVAASPLCDAPRFGRNLGAALRHAWRTWCLENDRAL
ncbi:MAG: tetratricopeptide repeat protein [Acetobacteraceae bacterium]|nr:tetratricopeptide repeat protein [Acetobacteraceae bacterium]